MSDELTEEQEGAQEARQLRKLFIEPGCVTVARSSGLAWATDGFVMLDVTGTRLGALQDGAYRIVATTGYRESKGASLDADLALDLFASDCWSDVVETCWSVFDDEAKLYLLSDRLGIEPYAVNEDLWRSFNAAYPSCRWQADADHDKTRFRVVHDKKIIAYIAGVRLEGRILDAAIALISVP